MIGELVNLIRPAIHQTWDAVVRIHGVKVGYRTVRSENKGIELKRCGHVFKADIGGFLQQPEYITMKRELPEMYKVFLKYFAFYFGNNKTFDECESLETYIRDLSRQGVPIDRAVMNPLKDIIWVNGNNKAKVISGCESEIIKPLFANEWLFWLYEANNADKHLDVSVVEVSNTRYRNHKIISSRSRSGWRNYDREQGYGNFMSLITEDNAGTDHRELKEYEAPCFAEEYGCFLVQKTLTLDDELANPERQRPLIESGEIITRTTTIDYTFEFYSTALDKICTGYLSELLTDGIDKAEKFVEDLQQFL